MAQVDPQTKITEPIPAIVRPGRPPKAEVPNSKHQIPNTQNSTNTNISIVPPMPEDLPQGHWSEQAEKVLRERYLLKNESGEILETADQMCWRVAWDIACAEANFGHSYERIMEVARQYYHLLATHEFLPNSPTLMNAGKNNGLQYSGCYVLPIDDSLIGIFDGIKYAAIIHQSGGGTGFSFSRLRPAGSRVGSSHGVASGPVSFLQVYDSATEQIKQGGSRRGANMGVLRIDHPDVLKFIHCKEDGGITNFNISVAVTDKFIQAVKEGTTYDLIDPHTKKVTAQLDARQVMEEIAQGAWKTGDPGLIFIDRINAGSGNPVPSLGPVETTNPCGEQPLYPFDVCNLGSIFLTYFVKDNNGQKEVDWEKLEKVTKLAVRFLDSVIERNPYPLPQVREMSRLIRRIGLGVGGWADMLVQLGIPYNSDEAIVLAEKVMGFVKEKSHEASQELAQERGTFPMFAESIYRDGPAMRNATVTTIAPTGSIGVIAHTSTGIEPLFAIAFKHVVKDKFLDREMSYFNNYFEKAAIGQSWYTPEVKEKIVTQGTIAHINEIPEEVRRVFATAHEISYDWHVKMQAAFQKYTDNAVSKTINLPHDATAEDIKNAYLLAYETGCMGITVYRDGCKDMQVLNLGTKTKEAKEEPKTNGHAVTAAAEIMPRPVKVDGATYKIETPLGRAYITVNQDAEGNPYEVFISVGKAGSEVAAMAEAIGRLISTTLRFGNHLPARERAREIVNQLHGIGGGSAVGFGPNRVRSLPDAVAKAISMHFGLSGQIDIANLKLDAEAQRAKAEDPTLSPKYLSAKRDLCPSCGAAAFVFEEGCSKCYACGYSKC
ncbi:vitamin B12-dependent ribonucleotide reductase [Patescibacteria group bacterium]|nr:vitamin B12-dependent ribonucleotide reductase [Patescibacteria group bacterium]